MRILISGSSGLVGTALASFLSGKGHEIVRLVRSASQVGPGAVFWNPDRENIDASGLEGVDAVVHLAGESLARGSWTAHRKAVIRNSRVRGTTLLCSALAQLKRPPAVIVSASAIGYYGHRGESPLSEGSMPGAGFLPSVCQEWEAATAPAYERKIRVVLARFGIILSKHGGALPKMLAPFRLALGGVLGDGRQYWSWIAIDDVVGAIWHAVQSIRLQGPVNVVAPNPATNREFTTTLGRVIHRPTFFRVPKFVLKAGLGQMADEALLASTRVVPTKLIQSGYRFQFPALQPALEHVLSND